MQKIEVRWSERWVRFYKVKRLVIHYNYITKTSNLFYYFIPFYFRKNTNSLISLPSNNAHQYWHHENTQSKKKGKKGMERGREETDFCFVFSFCFERKSICCIYECLRYIVSRLGIHHKLKEGTSSIQTISSSDKHVDFASKWAIQLTSPYVKEIFQLGNSFFKLWIL